MPASFRVFFRRRRQFFDVYLHDVHPNTFERKGGGRWGYFVAEEDPPRYGKFGEIHLVKSRVRPDAVQHELDHLRSKWMFQRWIILTPRNEEWFCTFGDELIRNFYREYAKYQQQTASANQKGSVRSRKAQ